MGLCARGPNWVVYPEGIWYSGVTLADVPEIVSEHFQKGQPVARLMNTDVAQVKAEIADNRNRMQAALKARDAAGVLPDDFSELVRGFQSSRIVLSAIELDLFSAVATLGENATAAGVAEAVACDAHGIEILLNALAALNLLCKRAGVFANTPLAAKGLPSPAELALLEPYRAELDPEVFGPMVVQPSTKPPGSVRQSLTRALELFAAAGWQNKDGVLRNSKGEPFVIEVSGARAQSPYMDPIYLNLTKLGVVLTKRLTDTVAGRKRMNDFDYDFVSVSLREARMPGAELWRNFNSQDADVPGSENIAGVKSRVVDDLINMLLDANSQEELEVAAHALDRVLMHAHYFIPWRYLTKFYLIYNHRLKRPARLPLYYGANEWALATWWDGTLPATAATK